MSVAGEAATLAPLTGREGQGTRALGARAVALLRVRWELLSVLVLAATLNLWDLGQNGWANTYYSAAVRSMSGSFHNFLYASMDSSGVMTVDKPPLALWVQTISVKLFGFHPLSILVPQALMGVATVALVYDLTRRYFGRLGGFAAAFVLAITPITVAISRHNNPDALLILCCVTALWCFVRALEDGRTRWLVWTGVAVGLGFETKMAAALLIVPGIVLAWLWIAPKGRLASLRQLLAGGGAMLVVGGAWPLLVMLTPANDRPWISGTADNSILSLIFGYNGIGRVGGQSGGPGGTGGFGGGGNSLFGGSTGPLRLLNSALGGQAGWMLGFALVAGLAVLVGSRLRRGDARTGWLIATGGAFATTAVVFSFAQGIFHPYYTSLLAPFGAILVGGGIAQLRHSEKHLRVLAPLAVAGGVATELVVLHNNSGQLTWLVPLLIAVGAVLALALVLLRGHRARVAALLGLLALLSVAPTTWAFDTLGHATSGTFPAGGPVSAGAGFGGGGAGFGGGRGRLGGGRRFGGFGAGHGAIPQGGGGQGFGGPPAGAGQGFPGAPTSSGAQGGGFPGAGARAGGFGGGGGFAQGGGGFGGSDASLTSVISYAKAHGGGAIAVASQSTAASAILDSHANVVGIGGFSGNESEVTMSWFAHEVSSGKIRWVVASDTGGGAPSDNRVGATKIIAAVEKACTATTVSTQTVYDCSGDSAALLAIG